MGRFDQVEFPDGLGYSRHGSPTFYKLLEEAAETHDRKSHDYASNDNPSGNYHFAGRMALLFAHSPEDAGFVGRLAEKLYRIANIEREGKTVKNETIEDTEVDIFTICGLWIADRRNRRLAANKVSYGRFVGESKDIRDAFLNMANQLTPNDLEVVFAMIGSLLRKGMGEETKIDKHDIRAEMSD